MLAEQPPQNPPTAAAQPPALNRGTGSPRHVDSATLLGPQGEVLIHHQQQVYRLRVTSLGKLILTK